MYFKFVGKNISKKSIYNVLNSLNNLFEIQIFRNRKNLPVKFFKSKYENLFFHLNKNKTL